MGIFHHTPRPSVTAWAQYTKTKPRWSTLRQARRWDRTAEQNELEVDKYLSLPDPNLYQAWLYISNTDYSLRLTKHVNLVFRGQISRHVKLRLCSSYTLGSPCQTSNEYSGGWKGPGAVVSERFSRFSVTGDRDGIVWTRITEGWLWALEYFSVNAWRYTSMWWLFSWCVFFYLVGSTRDSWSQARITSF
jgi:hypothetical protein